MPATVVPREGKLGYPLPSPGATSFFLSSNRSQAKQTLSGTIQGQKQNSGLRKSGLRFDRKRFPEALAPVSGIIDILIS